MKTKIGNFELGSPLGSTPNSRVFNAVEHIGQGLTRNAVIKVLRVVGESAAERDEIRREAEILVKLGTSPNVVQLYDYGIDDEVGPWLAMEHLGPSLKERITPGPADPNLVRRVAVDALHGLASIHNNNPSFLHRDVKPAHLLSTTSGSWKLVDFGLASVRNEASTLNLLTVQYAAPELLDRQLGAASPSTDLYSLGMTLYHLALGEDKYRPEFPSIYFDDLAKWDDSSPDRWPKWMFWHCSMEQKAKPLTDLLPGFPQDLSEAIAWMMAKPLDERAGTAEEVLGSLSGGGGAAAPQAQSTGPTVVKTATGGAGAWSAPAASKGTPKAASSSGSMFDPDVPEKKSAVSPLALGLVAAIVLLVTVAGAFFLMSRGGSSWEIRVPDGQQGNTGVITVQGRLLDLPAGWSAELRTETGSPVKVDINPANGDFRGDVIVPNVGTLPVQLVVLNGEGRPVGDRQFRVERLPPANIELTFQTVPAVAEARIRVVNPDTEEEIGAALTDANGRYRTIVGYGRVRIEVEHERYERFVDTGPTGASPTRTVEIPLRASSIEARFQISPPNAEVEVILADSGERRTIRLDSTGSAQSMLPLGSHVVLIRAPGFVEQEHVFEVTRRTRNRFQESLVRVGQVQQDEQPKDFRQLSEAQLLILPLSDLRDVIEAHAGLAGLRIEEVPELNSVRISGNLLNQDELQRLVLRVQKAGRRVLVEASPNASAIGRELRRWMVDRGDSESTVTALPNRLFVRFTANSPINRNELEAQARRYVYEGALVEIGP